MIKTILKMAESLVNLSCLYTSLNERVTKLEEKKTEVLEEEENAAEAQFQKGLDSILNYCAGRVKDEDE